MLTLVNKTTDTDGMTHTEYACDFVAKCDGTSLWADTNNLNVHVTYIDTFEGGDYGEDYKQVDVTHDADWEIYTDRGFEAAISAALGFEVGFTEQGMQDTHFASMEGWV